MHRRELKLFSPKVFEDERGYFFEGYRKTQFPNLDFVQDNVSFSKKGTIRALHLQTAPGQDKLVSCLFGEIWDVAVDLRPDSETFMKWQAFLLSDQNHHQLFIPKGFAHGFCVLSTSAIVHYKTSSFYDPNTEISIRWNDPCFNIDWPVKDPILSPRDQLSPFFKEVKDALGYRS